jgi:hypothetical protein
MPRTPEPRQKVKPLRLWRRRVWVEKKAERKQGGKVRGTRIKAIEFVGGESLGEGEGKVSETVWLLVGARGVVCDGFAPRRTPMCF